MKVLTESTATTPARLRPTAEQVCAWYEQTLRAMGSEDVQRTSPTTLEFGLLVSHGFLVFDERRSLATISRGELEVSETSDGFSVSVEARASTLASVLPVAVLVGATGGFAILDSPIKWVLAVAATSLAGFIWLRARSALNRLLEVTNEEIMQSFAKRPPMAHNALPPDDERLP